MLGTGGLTLERPACWGQQAWATPPCPPLTEVKLVFFKWSFAYFLPSEAHSKEEEASNVLSSDRAQTETDDMLPARKGHIQILLDSQLPLYEQYRFQLNQAGKENIYVCLSGGPSSVFGRSQPHCSPGLTCLRACSRLRVDAVF